MSTTRFSPSSQGGVPRSRGAWAPLVLGIAMLPASARGQTTILTNPSQFSGTETVITFDTIPSSPIVPVTNQFYNQGVLFAGDNGVAPRTITEANARQFGPAGQRALRNDSPLPANNIVLSFRQDITRVAFEVRAPNAVTDDLLLSLTCSCGGSPIGSTCFTITAGTTYRFVGLESTTPFDHVTIDARANGCAGGAGIGTMRIDNLRFEGPPKCDVSSTVYESAQYDACPPHPQFPTLELCQGGASISGPPNGPTQYLGSRFHVRETFQVSAVGGQIQGPFPQLGLGDQHIFAAIVALAGPTALPVGGAPGEPFSLSELVAATTFHPGLGGNDVRTPLSATLTPGDYALIFGAGDVPGFSTFDTTGDASMPVSTVATMSTIIQWDGVSWIDNFYGPGFGPRFVVEGTTLFQEGQGITTGVMLNGSRSRDVEGFPANFQWSTDCPGGSIDTPTASTATLTLDSTNTCPSGVTCNVTLVVDDGNDSSGANPSSTCNWIVSIDDTTKPTMNCPTDATGLACSADTSVSARGAATANDTYGVASVNSSDASTPGCGASLTIARTWTATDNCNNSSSCVQTISTSDAAPPTVTCPTDALGLVCTADTGVSARGSASAGDDCGSASVGFADAATPGCATTVSIVRTWTATDECNKTSTCEQLISTVDITPPDVICPPNATGLACGADTSPSVRGTASGDDDCGSASISSTDAATLGCGTTVSITRTWTATDECGNFAPCDQAISTTDTVPPAITVNTTPIILSDVNCSGAETATLPTASALDGCVGAVPVTNDAPASFPAGATTIVHYQASDACVNTATAEVNVTVRHGAHILVSATKFVVGLGHHPSVNKQPIAGIPIHAYLNAPGSCARQKLNGNWGLLVLALPDIIANCTAVSTGTTAANGTVVLDVPPGDYVIGTHFDSDGDSDLDQYLGDKVHNLTCGETERSRLFMVVVNTGKKFGCKWHYFEGSELVIVEPEEVVWDEAEQLYPFVFDSIGDWGVTVSVAPPEGFVADYDELSEQVSTELEAVQFTITEVGSDLVPTKTEFAIGHKGRIQQVKSSVGIRLTPSYARERGFNVAELEARGLIKELPQTTPDRDRRPPSPRRRTGE